MEIVIDGSVKTHLLVNHRYHHLVHLQAVGLAIFVVGIVFNTFTQAAEAGHLHILYLLVAEHVGVQFHFDARGVEQTDGSLRCTIIRLGNLIYPMFMLIIKADIALIDDGGMLQVPDALSERRFRCLEAVHLKRRRIHVGDGRRAGDESLGVDGTIYILLRHQFRFTRGS